MLSGIYIIYNTVTCKGYIGQSNNFTIRWKKHTRDLDSNKHKNKHLQYSWNKYGKDSFEFKILEYCEIIELTKTEQKYINLYGIDNLYNICPASESRLGTKWSFQSRKKLSETKKGCTPWNKGKKTSAETKLKQSESKKLFYKQGGKIWNLGVSPSLETRTKISVTLKARI